MPSSSASSLSRTVAAAGFLPAVAVPAWFTFSRLLTDSEGTLTAILAGTALPALVIVYLLAILLPRRWKPFETSKRGVISTRAAAFLVASWILGLIFGLTVPDFGPSASSLLVALAGPDLSGVSAAISNPTGILMAFCAAMGLGFSIADGRRAARDPQAAIDDDAVLDSYGYTFMDESP